MHLEDFLECLGALIAFIEDRRIAYLLGKDYTKDISESAV
jgi:hypothetical protein